MEVEGAALAEDSAMQEPGAKVGAAPGVQARQTHELRQQSRARHGHLAGATATYKGKSSGWLTMLVS